MEVEMYRNFNIDLCFHCIFGFEVLHLIHMWKGIHQRKLEDILNNSQDTE